MTSHNKATPTTGSDVPSGAGDPDQPEAARSVAREAPAEGAPKRAQGGGVSPLRRDGTARIRPVGAGFSEEAEGASETRRRAIHEERLRERRAAQPAERARPSLQAERAARLAGEDRPDDAAPPMPSVKPATLRRRHYGVILSFALLVLLPIALTSWYMWTRAVDQYESRVGFAVRAEGQATAPDLFGGLLGPTTSSTAEDMHILNEFILSQEIVSRIDAKLGLRARYARFPEDQVYALSETGTIEDLVDYWQRMVVVDYDTGSGLMELTVYAFTPQDAQDIAAAVLEESNQVINNLSAIAREDSTRYARETLETARTRASEARAALADFRARNQVADPTADVTSQAGVVSSLQQQLATSMVELDLIRATGKANDPRVVQLERRITAIEGRIEEERANLGIGAGGSGFAEVLSEYQRLTVETTFAEQAYLAALAGFDGAMSSAAQKSRYLANYIPPSLAEASTAPQRPLVVLVIGLIAFFLWSSLVLIYYALRDRR